MKEGARAFCYFLRDIAVLHKAAPAVVYVHENAGFCCQVPANPALRG